MAQRAMIPGRIVLVGTGNVASHLAEALGERISAVISRDAKRAAELARKCNIKGSGDYTALRDFEPELIIISVADHALPAVAEAIGHISSEPLVLHTSGTVPKEVLGTISHRTGVLYPLQTFSRDVYVDMHTVPFFTEASVAADLAVVDSVANAISDTVHHADASQRQVLHIAGVFSSNFVNIILEMVHDILGEADYPLATVRPLVEATVAKAFIAGPHAAQTGPARRGDKAVMAKHARALPDDKRRVYELLSEYIIKSQNVTLQ